MVLYSDESIPDQLSGCGMCLLFSDEHVLYIASLGSGKVVAAKGSQITILSDPDHTFANPQEADRVASLPNAGPNYPLASAIRSPFRVELRRVDSLANGPGTPSVSCTRLFYSG